MRTTIDIDDRLVVELRELAADTGLTLDATIEDALRETLHRRRVVKRPAVDLPVFHGTGVMPRVCFTDSAGLLELMRGPHDSA